MDQSKWDRWWSIGVNVTFMPTGGLVIADLARAMHALNTGRVLVNTVVGLAAVVILVIDSRWNP